MLTLLCLVEQLFSWNIDGLLKDKTAEQVFRKNNLLKLCGYVDIWSPEQMGATQAERLQCPKGQSPTDEVLIYKTNGIQH